MALTVRWCVLLDALLLFSVITRATETRIITLGGNPLLLPDDELEVFIFPHRLAERQEEFLDADLSREYVVYGGRNIYSRWAGKRQRSLH
jgi:hypothetical protein